MHNENVRIPFHKYKYSCMYLCFIYYMDNTNYFRDLCESKSDYRKIVLLIFLIKNDSDLVEECGYLKDVFNCLYKEVKMFQLKRKK